MAKTTRKIDFHGAARAALMMAYRAAYATDGEIEIALGFFEAGVPYMDVMPPQFLPNAVEDWTLQVGSDEEGDTVDITRWGPDGDNLSVEWTVSHALIPEAITAISLECAMMCARFMAAVVRDPQRFRYQTTRDGDAEVFPRRHRETDVYFTGQLPDGSRVQDYLWALAEGRARFYKKTEQ